MCRCTRRGKADETFGTATVTFFVKGTPVPQGSKAGFVRGGRVVLVEMSDRKTKTAPAGRLTRWRDSVRSEAMLHATSEHPYRGRVALGCEFCFERPKSHLTKRGGVRKGAPDIPRGDLDKLVRAVSDALTGVLYLDDVQISEAWATKAYTLGQAGVRVQIGVLPESGGAA